MRIHRPSPSLFTKARRRCGRFLTPLTAGTSVRGLMRQPLRILQCLQQCESRQSARVCWEFPRETGCRTAHGLRANASSCFNVSLVSPRSHSGSFLNLTARCSWAIPVRSRAQRRSTGLTGTRFMSRRPRRWSRLKRQAASIANRHTKHPIQRASRTCARCQAVRE